MRLALDWRRGDIALWTLLKRRFLRASVGDYKKLNVWRKSHELTLAIYKATAKFPPDERFGLKSQLRRAASSVPANLAEGCGRRTDRELDRYVRISLGSATELEYHILLARDIGCFTTEVHDRLAVITLEVQEMLVGLRQSLKPAHTTHNSSTRLIAPDS
jgi:four helix bundle protein